MKKKSYGEKFIKRRKKWFLKAVGEDEDLRKAKEIIDENYDEAERDSVYALSADLLVQSYPFCYDDLPEDIGEVMTEKYGLELIELRVLLDIFEEVGLLEKEEE